MSPERELTRRRIGVVLWELHRRFEVAAVVEGVWVEDDQADGPVENVFFVQLG